VKRILALLLCCCLLFTGCAQFVESEKQRIGKEIEWLKEKFSEISDALDLEFSKYPANSEHVQNVDLCRSFFSEDGEHLYNPFSDFGLILSAEWEAEPESLLLGRFNVTSYDMESPDNLAYIPDCGLISTGYISRYAVIYIHNLAADEYFGSGSITSGDEYAEINISWFEDMGYQYVTRDKDIRVGDHSYQIVRGHLIENEELSHTLYAISRHIKDDYFFNLNILCYENPYHELTDYIFNSSSKPYLVNLLVKENAANQAAADDSEADHAVTRKPLDSSGENSN